MPKSSEQNRAASLWRSVLAGAMVTALVAAPQTAIAGEGGTSHILPGANATLVDALPTAPGWNLRRGIAMAARAEREQPARGRYIWVKLVISADVEGTFMGPCYVG